MPAVMCDFVSTENLSLSLNYSSLSGYIQVASQAVQSGTAQYTSKTRQA
jgi:hypothetical protein